MSVQQGYAMWGLQVRLNHLTRVLQKCYTPTCTHTQMFQSLSRVWDLGVLCTPHVSSGGVKLWWCQSSTSPAAPHCTSLLWRDCQGEADELLPFKLYRMCQARPQQTTFHWEMDQKYFLNQKYAVKLEFSPCLQHVGNEDCNSPLHNFLAKKLLKKLFASKQLFLSLNTNSLIIIHNFICVFLKK